MRGSSNADAGGDSPPDTALARELLARLLPTANPDLLLAGLMAERNALAAATVAVDPRPAQHDAPSRELQRVRTQLALGDASRAVQHAVNNALTALLAEAQLLALEPLREEHRTAVDRIVEQARRVALATRRLDVSPPSIG